MWKKPENMFIVLNWTGSLLTGKEIQGHSVEAPAEHCGFLNLQCSNRVQVGGNALSQVKSWGGQDYNLTRNISGFTSVMGVLTNSEGERAAGWEAKPKKKELTRQSTGWAPWTAPPSLPFKPTVSASPHLYQQSHGELFLTPLRNKYVLVHNKGPPPGPQGVLS